MGTDLYPHMPILRVARAMNESACARATLASARPASVARALADSSDLGLLRSKVPRNV